jgi:carboxymethylenebutenolidase
MTRLAVAATILALGAVSSFGTNSVSAASDSVPLTIHFAGPAKLDLVGYLFLPAKPAGRMPAIVMMHGRAGPYSSLADGVYDATTLSKRHTTWGKFWAAHGYAALLVDSFGPRGYPAGFATRSYENRPDVVNEVTVRPFDAYAALAYLRSRPDVNPHRIALQGWSNGGSAALATMADATLKAAGLKPQDGFLGAVAFYPGCGLHGAFDKGYRPYAPVHVFSGENDEEVSTDLCKRFVDASSITGGDIAITIYPGATHDFDDPGRKRQSVEANAQATSDAVPNALVFIQHLFQSVK